jgi:hypothetical protein
MLLTQELVKETEKKKPYISMRKIASYRKNLVKTEKGRSANAVFSVVAFEHEGKVSFICGHGCRQSPTDHKFLFSNHFTYTLSLKTNKDGQKRFTFYKVNKDARTGANKVITVSPNRLRDKIEQVFVDTRPKNKRDGLPKVQLQRLLSVVRAFLRRNGISYKGLSKDPFCLMYQLCYPGSANFHDQTVRNLGCSRHLRNDPLKEVLRTKGKLSRRLLYGAIMNHPRASNKILILARYIRIHKSLDHAQQFLKAVSECKRYLSDDPFMVYKINSLKVGQMKVFDKLEVTEFVEVVRDSLTVSDTFRMIEQLGGNNGFNHEQIQYKTLRELHDQLSQMVPGIGRRGHTIAFKHYDFDATKPSMEFCSLLSERMSKYKVEYAKNTLELEEQAKKMHNCSFFYHSSIASGGYAIFCIDDKYMFGVNLTRAKGGSIFGGIVELDQAVTFCNRKIEEHELREMNQEIERVLSGVVDYWYCGKLGVWEDIC